MNPLIKLAFLYSLSVFFVQSCFAQDDMVSIYKPKTKTEKLVIAKLRSLSEIVQHYEVKGEAKPDVMINAPDSSNKYYRFQIGFDHPDRFATSYWLSIDPKTYKVYFWDFFDSRSRDISLQQWRRWRGNPGFFKDHTWKNGRLIVLKIKPHVKKKSSDS